MDSDDEIEMNDLLGHSEQIMSWKENDVSQDEGIGPLARSEQHPRKRGRFQCLILFFLLVAAVSYLADTMYLSREHVDTLLEPDDETRNAKPNKIDDTEVRVDDEPEAETHETQKAEPNKTEGMGVEVEDKPKPGKQETPKAKPNKIEGTGVEVENKPKPGKRESPKAKRNKVKGTEIDVQGSPSAGNPQKENAMEKHSIQSGKCADNVDFRFKDKPEKDCNWVATKKEKVCHKNRIKKGCPATCGVCAQDDQEIQVKAPGSSSVDDGSDTVSNNIAEGHEESDTKNAEDGEHQPTLVAGVPDQDLYCEDLSRYEEWHKIKISKDSGKMFSVVDVLKHDRNSFTQGLTYARGTLFESAGLFGKSTVRILDPDYATVQTKVSIEKKYFAEGLAYYKDTLVQVTWKSHQGFVYNITNLEKIDEFTFKTTLNEGWGITWDRCKDELIVTDGSENLHFWDPKTMKEIRRVSVERMDGKKALEMNEIEFWRGRILANIWFEDVILVIDPETGIVEKEYDFSELWPKHERKKYGADVLNGISISGNPDVLYITGKLWNRMYKIFLLPEL